MIKVIKIQEFLEVVSNQKVSVSSVDESENGDVQYLNLFKNEF